MKKLILILGLSFSIPMCQTACNNTPSTRTTEVQTLKIVGASAKASIDAAAQLLAQGQITVAQFQKVANAYDTQFQPTYALAVAAAQSDLSSVASPDLVSLAAQLAALVAQLTAK